MRTFLPVPLAAAAILATSLLGGALAEASSLNVVSWESSAFSLGGGERAAVVAGADGGAGFAAFAYDGTEYIAGAAMSPEGVWDDSVTLSSAQHPYPGMSFIRSQPAIVSRGPGEYLAAWVQIGGPANGPIAVASRYDGNSWLIDDSLSVPFAGSPTSQVAENSLSLTVNSLDGGIYASAIDDSGTPTWMVSKSTDGGQTWSTPTRSVTTGISPKPTQTFPSAALAGDTLYMVALDEDDEYKAYVWMLDLTTSIWSVVPFTSPDFASGEIMPTSIAAHDDSVIVSWIDPSEYWVGYSTSNDAGQSWSDDTFIDASALGSDWHEAVAVSEFGFVYIYVSNLRPPHYIRVRDSRDGSSWTAPRALGTLTSYPQVRNVAASADAAGNLLITWIEEDTFSVWSQLYQGAAGQWDDSAVLTGVAGTEELSASGGPAARFALVFNAPNFSDLVVSTSLASPSLFPANPATAAAVGVPYPPYTFTAQAWPRPQFSTTAPLPPGLTLDPATGVLAGTPTLAGSFTFRVEAANSQTPSSVSDPITIIVASSDPVPASAPRQVAAQAADRSATIGWQPPASFGSFDVTSYQVVSSPGGHACVTSSLNCTVTGLTNGTSYTFKVRALSGAGWSADSEPSNAVVPQAAAGPAIVITGSRAGDRIEISGTSTGFGMGGTLRPWLRFRGQSAFSEGAATILVGMDGTFDWGRRTGKRVSVYVQTPDGSVRSNVVTIR